MSGLLSILGTGAQGLTTFQAWSSTVAHNLANASTPGFSRQRVELQAIQPAERYGTSALGRGVLLAGVTQARDRFLEAQMPLALGNQSASATEAGLLKGITALDVEGGVGSAVSAFYASLRSLSQNPGSLPLREGAVAAAGQAAARFRTSAVNLAAARDAIDQGLAGKLPELNSSTAQIAALNTRVREARGSGVEPNDLLDARQRLVDRVAELTGAAVVPNSEGDANLVMPDGTALVLGDSAAVVSAQPDPARDGHLALWATAPDGKGSKVVGEILGELGGMIAARDGALAEAQRSVDQLAFDFAGAVNTAHALGFGLDGGTGRALFTTSATAPGAARNLEVEAAIAQDARLLATAATAAGLPGDATALQTIIDTERQALSTGLAFTDSLSQLTTRYGASAARAQAVNEADQAILGQINAQRQSVSGVSIDEELVDMQRAQRAYEAMAKVITTTDQMLDTLMSLK